MEKTTKLAVLGMLCMIVGVASIVSGFVVVDRQQTRGASEYATTNPAATPASTVIPYPSYQDAEAVIMYYYVKQSDFKGKNVIRHFDSLTYGMQVGESAHPQFTACAQYQYALADNPTVTVATARHTFTFQYRDGGWIVVDMGNWNSC